MCDKPRPFADSMVRLEARIAHKNGLLRRFATQKLSVLSVIYDFIEISEVPDIISLLIGASCGFCFSNAISNKT